MKHIKSHQKLGGMLETFCTFQSPENILLCKKIAQLPKNSFEPTNMREDVQKGIRSH